MARVCIGDNGESLSAEVIEEWSKIVGNAMEKADRMVEILEQWLEEQDAKKKKIT